MDIFLQFLGAAYFVFALLNLRWAVLLLPLFFPAYLLKFYLFGVPFPITEVFIDVTFLAWILRTVWDLFKHKISWKQLLEPYNKKWGLAVAGIVVASIISALITPQSVVMMDGNTVFYGRKVALGILKSWIVAPVMMLMLFAWVVRTGKDMKAALNSYVGSSVFIAAWGVFQFLTGRYITPDGRASGPFNSANYLALFITPALFYALVRLKDYLSVHQVPWWKKIMHLFVRHDDEQRSRFFHVLVWTFAFVLLLFGVLFTKSYAAFLSIFVACLLWFGVNFKTWRRFPWKTVLIVVALLVLIAVVVIALDPAKWELFFQFTQRTSSGVRVEIYTIATKLLLEHPVQGIGLGMFPAAYQLEGPHILGHDPYEWNMLHPHNVFLAFWLNLGLLGFLSLLGLMKVCFQKGWAYLKKFHHLEPLSVQWFHGLGLMMFVIIFVHGLADTPFFKNDLALLFWLVVSLILLPAGEEDTE